jgi:hypothetical protein
MIRTLCKGERFDRQGRYIEVILSKILFWDVRSSNPSNSIIRWLIVTAWGRVPEELVALLI